MLICRDQMKNLALEIWPLGERSKQKVPVRDWMYLDEVGASIIGADTPQCWEWEL